MIDFDNPLTFPQNLRNELQEYISSELQNHAANVNIEDITQQWVDNESLPYELAKNNLKAQSFLVWHISRIEDPNAILQQGLLSSLENSKARTLELLKRLDLDKKTIEHVLQKAQVYWDRDTGTRISCVHFLGGKSFLKSSSNTAFALNLGGEILRWAIRDIGKKLYSTEPYKRLWIWGQPSIIGFECTFNEMNYVTQNDLIRQLLNFYIYKHLDSPYTISFTGIKMGDVLPQSIIEIKTIPDFHGIQSQYEPAGFYNEILK